MATSCLTQSCPGYLSGSAGKLFTSSLNFLFTAQCMLTENWPKDSSTNDSTFDFIIVGAGSAGSVLASRLTEDKCTRVLLIEAGGDPSFESTIPQFAYSLPGNPDIDWIYKTENDSVACKGTKDGKCFFPRGKLLGGSSSINGLIYIRGSRQNYDDLEKSGNIGWNFDEALYYFKKSENLSSPEIKNDPILKSYHNFDGLLGVSKFDPNNPLEEYIDRAYGEIGYPVVNDVNGPTQHGLVNSLVTVQDGKRESTARAFLVPASNRKNLVIFKKTLVTKILFKGNVATGVIMRQSDGRERIANAAKEVIISAGVINTPQLLMLSGIGPKKHLEQFKIPVLADLAVGQNFHDHLSVPIYMTVNKGAIPRSQSRIAFDVAEYVVMQKGFYAQTGVSNNPYITKYLITDVNNPYSFEASPNIGIYHVNYGVNSSGLQGYCHFGANFTDEICESMIKYNEDSEVLLIYPELLDTKSRGNISLASTDPAVYPKIYANFLSHPEDIENLLKAINLVLDLLKTAAFKELDAKVRRINIKECNKFVFLSKGYWKCILYQLATTGYHALGTAKMGPKSDPNAVVNADLEVYGIKHLRVVDGSVIPGTISANTNPAIIMFAERASDIIKKAHALEKHSRC